MIFLELHVFSNYTIAIMKTCKIPTNEKDFDIVLGKDYIKLVSSLAENNLKYLKSNLKLT